MFSLCSIPFLVSFYFFHINPYYSVVVLSFRSSLSTPLRVRWVLVILHVPPLLLLILRLLRFRLLRLLLRFITTIIIIIISIFLRLLLRLLHRFSSASASFPGRQCTSAAWAWQGIRAALSFRTLSPLQDERRDAGPAFVPAAAREMWRSYNEMGARESLRNNFEYLMGNALPMERGTAGIVR